MIHVTEQQDLTRQASAGRAGRSLLPFEVLELTDQTLATPRFVNEFTQTYLDILRDFIHNNVARNIAEHRQSRGMFEALERDTEWDADTDLSMGATGR